ncbi:hypothetical protein D3C85_979860 [compost metagenome]
MSKFKVGDKVICKESIGESFYIAGKVYTITKNRSDYALGEICINEANKYERELKIVEKVTMEEGCKEFAVEAQQADMVQSPNHYRLFSKDDIEGDFIEVKDVVKAILLRWQAQENISFDMYQAGCYKEMLQYLLRAPLKNNIEDVQKAEYYLKEILNEW